MINGLVKLFLNFLAICNLLVYVVGGAVLYLAVGRVQAHEALLLLSFHLVFYLFAQDLAESLEYNILAFFGLYVVVLVIE